jgi:putative flavoprotein involved in K+ transport
MRQVDTTVVIVGAGHSGLAMSRRLAERSIDHVVLERGEVANSWATERWDSLRLLTPNWQTRLPGAAYEGDDPGGYATAGEVVRFLRGYADGTSAPVQTGTTVTRVSATASGYVVVTDGGTWTATSVVLASGACNLPDIPAVAEGAPEDVASETTLTYRSPGHLPDGGVLVIGASASGLQIADELARAGRRVVISAGEHVRMPRDYRGRDIFWWMDAVGVLDERYDAMDDIVRARNVPSPQLVGTPDRRTLDLGALHAAGVEVVGRLGRIQDGLAQFSGGLANTCRLADLKVERLLDRFDAWAEATGVDELDAPHRLGPTPVEASPRLDLHLRREGIGTILWATGYRPDYSWLDVPVVDYKGYVKHDGGVVTGSPGMYLLGTTLLRRRRSTYISGAEADTHDIAEHLAGHLAGTPAVATSS